MSTNVPTRYRFALHNRRVSTITIVSAVMLLICGSIILLGINVGAFIIVAYLLATVGLVVLLPMLFVQSSYIGAGVWVGADEVRVQFPWEDLQQMSWSEARFAVDEGEEYLQLSKGKEGLGHIFSNTRYIGLHLEGLKRQQRLLVVQALAERTQVRHPRHFTLMTLLNSRGEVVARGRLYLFEQELLCVENRGKKRVFFYAPLKDLRLVKQVDSFHVGQLECEAISMKYAGEVYVIMLGYETTISTNLGTSSRWSSTGSAEGWLEVLQTKKA